jgi:hypothetical protein
MLLTDTVGFIQKLPTELVAAFRWGRGVMMLKPTLTAIPVTLHVGCP